MPEATTTGPTTDQEWADYLTDILNWLSDHGERLPAGAPLRELIEDTCESLGILAGYFAGGRDEDSDALFTLILQSSADEIQIAVQEERE